MRVEPPRPAPPHRAAAPAMPDWYRPEPEPVPSRPLTEPVYRSTAPAPPQRFAGPLREQRPLEPRRNVPPQQRRVAAPVAAPPGLRAPAPAGPAAAPLPAPGFGRGLPAVASPAPPHPPPPPRPALPPLPVPGVARGLPAPAGPAPPPPRPAPPPPPQPLTAARFGPGLPAPAEARGRTAVVASARSPAVASAPAPRLARPRPMGPLAIDPVRHQDLPAIIDLVNADLLPGQPACDRPALDMAMHGESHVDTSWWRELSNVRVAVASRGGLVVGAASYAVAAADRSGWLLWLHAREERTAAAALIDHVMAELSGSSHVYAFWIATALSLGVEALPVEQRPVTHELLTSRGLTGRDSWRYLVLPIERIALDGVVEDVAAIRPISGSRANPAWELVMGDREAPVASAEIALAGDGCAALRWLHVTPARRGRGIGRRLLRQALRFLALRGAQSVAAVVDHADPRERDPAAVLRLLGSAGFEEVDRLWSYESPRRR